MPSLAKLAGWEAIPGSGIGSTFVQGGSGVPGGGLAFQNLDDNALAMLKKIQQFDPNAKFVQAMQNYDNGEGSVQAPGGPFSLQYDATLMPKPKNDYKGEWAAMTNDSIDPSLHSWDDNYGDVTTYKNYKPQGKSWIDVVGPLMAGSAAMWMPMLAGAMGAGAAGAGAFGANTLGTSLAKGGISAIKGFSNGNFDPSALAGIAGQLAGLPSWATSAGTTLANLARTRGGK